MSPSIEEIMRVTTANRAGRVATDLMRVNDLSRILYADSKPATRWDLFVYRWRRRVERVRDAWLVLTGQAEIES